MLSEKWRDSLKLNRHNWSNLLSNFDWHSAREGVTRESRARVMFLGLPGAGKSTLLNRLCGWEVSPARDRLPAELGEEAKLEDFGLFCLVDLPPEPDHHLDLFGGSYFAENGLNGRDFHPEWAAAEPDYANGIEHLFSLDSLEPLELAEGADLLVYVLDGTAGVQPADYRWVGRLRRLGVPLLVVVNKSDGAAGGGGINLADIESRLAAGVLPVSARYGTNIADGLLPKMVNLCPALTVALGRELQGFRRAAVTRLIHRAALLNGLVALEPVPLIDLPVQIMTLTGLMLRIGAIYDRPPSEVRRREVAAAIAGGLAGRLAAQQLVKIVPVVGWAISSIIGWSCTWGLGRGAMAYFEAGGDSAVDRGWDKMKGGVNRAYRSVYHRWQARPRLRVEWGESPAAGEKEATDYD